MGRRYRILTTSLYARDIKQCLKNDPQLINIINNAQEILAQDPYNTTRRYNIKKLGGLRQGEGVFRLRIRDYRMRYDINKSDVILYTCRNRKDAYR
ncbi:type II toxin-antitoxin system RelE/ParE family toxin [Candidatus Uhrbacteria bacterium]|nr:type II toxin-antitoxin system RelE/ParE family toxin [Candidatus Uhrbacteria bacterium]